MKKVLRVLGILYLLMAPLLVLYSSGVFYFLNLGAKVFHPIFPTLEVMPESADRWGNVFAASEFVALSALCFLAAESPTVRGYALVHCLAKLIASLLFFYFFFNSQPYFIYVLGGTVEAVLFLAVLGCFFVSLRPISEPAKTFKPEKAD